MWRSNEMRARIQFAAIAIGFLALLSISSDRATSDLDSFVGLVHCMNSIITYIYFVRDDDFLHEATQIHMQLAKSTIDWIRRISGCVFVFIWRCLARVHFLSLNRKSKWIAQFVIFFLNLFMKRTANVRINCIFIFSVYAKKNIWRIAKTARHLPVVRWIEIDAIFTFQLHI